MSKKYVVEVEETLVKCVIVEAENATEAEHIAFDAYKNEEIILSADDYLDAEFKVLRVADADDISDYVEIYED